MLLFIDDTNGNNVTILTQSARTV